MKITIDLKFCIRWWPVAAPIIAIVLSWPIMPYGNIPFGLKQVLFIFYGLCWWPTSFPYVMGAPALYAASCVYWYRKPDGATFLLTLFTSWAFFSILSPFAQRLFLERLFWKVPYSASDVFPFYALGALVFLAFALWFRKRFPEDVMGLWYMGLSTWAVVGIGIFYCMIHFPNPRYRG